MLLHLATMWAIFVAFTMVFASDDPQRSRRVTLARTPGVQA
jgi:hypothetical protein